MLCNRDRVVRARGPSRLVVLRRTIFSQGDTLLRLSINLYEWTAEGTISKLKGGGRIPVMNQHIYPYCSTAQKSVTSSGNNGPLRRNGHLIFTCCARWRIFSQEINHISSIIILSIPHKTTNPFYIVSSWSFQRWKIQQFTDNISCRDWFGLERLGNIER